MGVKNTMERLREENREQRVIIDKLSREVDTQKTLIENLMKKPAAHDTDTIEADPNIKMMKDTRPLKPKARPSVKPMYNRDNMLFRLGEENRKLRARVMELEMKHGEE